MRINQDKIPLNEYYTRLTDFFIRHFGNTSIPSHDLSHHKRVWLNASYLMNQIEAGKEFVFDDRKRLQVLIACMLHDIGMATDSSVNHGRESRKLCELFLRDHIPDKSLHHDILIAVENHDNKEYTDIHPPDSLLTILSVADDTDAFGYIGIYRYIEIYSRRGIDHAAMREAVLLNAASRLTHLRTVYPFLPDFLKHQEKRFNDLKSFFSDDKYNKEDILQELICIIENGSERNISIHQTASSESRNKNCLLAEFFTNILSELSE